MASVRIQRARSADFALIAKRLDADNVRELAQGDGETPLEAVLTTWAKAIEAWALFVEGELAAVFGMTLDCDPATERQVRVGFLFTTPATRRRPVAVVRGARRWVRKEFSRRGLVLGGVHADHPTGVRLMRALGFLVAEAPAPTPPLGEPFYRVQYGGM